jgi:hypothetical protein
MRILVRYDLASGAEPKVRSGRLTEWAPRLETGVCTLSSPISVAIIGSTSPLRAAFRTQSIEFEM